MGNGGTEPRATGGRLTIDIQFLLSFSVPLLSSLVVADLSSVRYAANPPPASRVRIGMEMPSQMLRYVADHRLVLEQVAAAAGFAEPVAVDLDEFREPLLAKARRGPVLPLCGVLVRDWDPDFRRSDPGAPFGMRAYEVSGVRFVQVHFDPTWELRFALSHLTVVDRKDYRKLYRIALRCRRDQEPPVDPPVLAPAVRQALWENSIGY